MMIHPGFLRRPYKDDDRVPLALVIIQLVFVAVLFGFAVVWP